MLEAILDRKEKSAEYPSLSFPPRRLPPPPSPYKWAIMDEPDYTRRITRICDLPEKAVVEIMLWLPPKSLLGLKCVQKSWNNLISTLMKSQWFVAKHLKNSKSRPFVFKRTKPTYCFHETINSFLTVDEADHDNDQIRFHSKEFNLLESVAGLHGFHCDGIVFLPDRSTSTIVLCNPAIREFKLLPRFMLWIQLWKTHNGWIRLRCHFQCLQSRQSCASPFSPMLMLPSELSHNTQRLDQRSISRDKRDREYYSRSPRLDRSSDWTHHRREQKEMEASGPGHESKPSSSIMPKYYENTSSTSGLTSEHKSKSKDRRHGDRHENRSSEHFSRNTFEDRYDPSKSHDTYEDDISANSKHIRADKFFPTSWAFNFLGFVWKWSKSGVLKTDPSMVGSKALQLKQLQRLVRAIILLSSSLSSLISA
ncbi:hypothetical protein L484_007126 [Morus notabilis]|uniref:F-box domain-containing protein n=1 Tax=Morus notabilis TaxID=981085 RepID=W9S1W3_9ROSA|nr:hypothetical protein L484_007126 [Morus notabilis]